MVALATLASCTKLDENLKDTWTSSNFLTTPTEINAAIAASYQTLYSFGNSGGYFDLQCVTTDEMMIPQRGGDWYDGGVHLALHGHTYDGTTNSGVTWYPTVYSGVSACNRLLATSSVTSNTEAVAELHVLRAYYYFLLMDLWGNVPIVTQLGQAQPQSTPAQVYAFVESEITTNAAGLPKTVNYGHINYYGAQAILAKMYLNAARYLGSSTPAIWQKCSAACDLIINSGLYNLEGNFSNAFSASNQGSIENIFVVPYDHLYGQGFNLSTMTLHYSSQLTYTMTTQPWNGYCALETFYNSYQTGDKRQAASFLAGPQYYPDGKTPITDASYEKVSPAPSDPFAIADPDGANVNFTPHVNEIAPNALRQAGARIGKYTFYQGMTQNIDNDFPIYRYADILMTKAEALFNLNGWSDATGTGLVNQVHQRAGLAAYAVGAITPDELLAERGREFFAEAWRRDDLLRFGQLYGTVNNFQATWFGKTSPDADGHYALFPIPTTQITATAGTAGALKQNPGYAQ